MAHMLCHVGDEEKVPPVAGRLTRPTAGEDREISGCLPGPPCPVQFPPIESDAINRRG